MRIEFPWKNNSRLTVRRGSITIKQAHVNENGTTNFNDNACSFIHYDLSLEDVRLLKYFFENVIERKE